MLKSDLLEHAEKIIATLQSNGFQACMVGGCVRDLLMGRPLADVDIATSARPEEVISLFAGEKVYAVPTGRAHGTVTVILNQMNFEVTTYRKAEPNSPRLTFGTSLEEDLLHRDFTINAVAYSPGENRYVDPFDGRGDIVRRLIRAVGIPIGRFREDYLRMIRAHRFEAILEFSIEAGTQQALTLAAGEGWEKSVSIERIRDEMVKCFKQAARPSRMFEGMRKSGLLPRVLPELAACIGFAQNRHHAYDLYKHTLRMVDAVPRERPRVRWAALFHDLGKIAACENSGPDATFYGHEKISEEIARGIMRRFRFGTDEVDGVLNLTRHHMFHYSEEMRDASVRRLVASVGEENLADLCLLRGADSRAKGTETVSPGPSAECAGLLDRVARMARGEKVFKIRDLAIDGREVMEIAGISSGPRVGEILQALFEAVLEDPAKNTKAQLRRIVEELR